jgi:uncharacterized phage protein (TIGR01671 family)
MPYLTKPTTEIGEERQIKFRAWDESEQVMYSPEELSAKKMLLNPCCGHIIIPRKDTSFIPLQFTGLRDMNGEEIYEGDIVKAVFPNQYGQRQVDGSPKMESWTGAVALVRGAFCLQQAGDTHPLLGQYPEQFVEVIGNIYHCPEMLSYFRNLLRKYEPKEINIDEIF